MVEAAFLIGFAVLAETACRGMRMSGHEAVLFANDIFYQAFATRDLEALRELWAAEPVVTCIHPGWGPIFGRTAVLESFHAIFNGPNPPDVRCQAARAVLRGDTAYVLCYEHIDGQFLVATNIFTRSENQWRMIHHQAGPTATAPEVTEETPHAIN
ncbi:MAG TPA: DUF4440 domain-containing protein [Alphaproteobacteria bacterium]|nr:DUF4440 domain-containing protein [Alphaproteobacteria bacterium]HAM47280.1 DUF4440 domain-containing protein [Alphaproteobacteria bacterium]HBA42389.1 DUF4440 domain-containing protein [Alphaproteobacteria bacterium]HBC55306.1 DUF4440 domain-containing protein [Alphaproteobacteria bacterium]HCO91147.1 DUF4440 domain-containing protein [Alphaproteobacteria bacterium]